MRGNRATKATAATATEAWAMKASLAIRAVTNQPVGCKPAVHDSTACILLLNS